VHDPWEGRQNRGQGDWATYKHVLNPLSPTAIKSYLH